MVNQDPHFGSVAGDSGHETMVTNQEDEPINDTDILVGATGGAVDKSVTVEHLSDVEWREDDSLFVFNDDVTKPQIPAAASTPIHTFEENEVVLSHHSNPLWERNLAFWSQQQNAC